MADLLFKDDGYTDTIGFILQQGMGKCLKGLLVVNQIDPPRIHDLKVLLNKAFVYLTSAPDYFQVCLMATKYYLEDRYPPGPVNMPLREDIRMVLHKAFKLMEEIKEIIERA
ncbi:MAG: HEPN domain-containing protein [Candidatus Schekmanbacteria bacterium]|nr:HEPN domain-containing protein [Candidatus Schekmanbacteria bacterium]